MSLAACALASSGSGDGTATDVSLRIEVPSYGEFGLGSLEFSFAEPLTDAERRNVHLEMTAPGRDKLVVAAATVSRDGRKLTVVAGMARRRTTGRHRHALSLEGTARARSDDVEGGAGYLMLGASWLEPSRARRSGSKARSAGDEAHLAPGSSAGAVKSAPRNAPACPAIERLLAHSRKPILLSGARMVRLPSHTPRNGSKAVAGGTRAGLVLDQLVGEFCRRDFKSAWLRSLVSRRR